MRPQYYPIPRTKVIHIHVKQVTHFHTNVKVNLPQLQIIDGRMTGTCPRVGRTAQQTMSILYLSHSTKQMTRTPTHTRHLSRILLLENLTFYLTTCRLWCTQCQCSVRMRRAATLRTALPGDQRLRYYVKWLKRAYNS